MAAWTVPLADVSFTEDEIEAVADVYRSGWLSQGARVAAFEAAAAAYLDVPHTVAVASGTAALHLVCVAIGLGPGDEVVLPSLTFAASAAVVHQTGATPVFADIRAAERPWLSVEAAEAAIGPRTRAIITVDYAGHPGEAMALRDLADQRGIKLVEDAAHALGARTHGVAAGAIGHAGAFSFFANKNLPLGEGGLIATADAGLAQRVRLLRSHGLSSDTWARHSGERAAYEVLEPGFNYRLDEPRAALGRLLLQHLDADNDARARRARVYEDALRDVPRISAAIATQSNARNAWHIYPVLLDPGVDRSLVRARLHERGVQTSIHYPPLHQTRAFASADDGLPVTEDYARRTMTIPLFPHLTEAQQGEVIDALAEAVATG